MNEQPDASPKRSRLRGLLVDTTPLRESPAFARLWIGTSVSQIGAQVTIVAVGLNVYDLTGSTLAVSLVALWALGPMIIAGFVGGALADRFDRRAVSLVTAIVAWLSISTMAGISFVGVQQTWPYYALAAVNASAATILGATRGAILPRLLSTQLLPAAAALSGLTMGLAITVGPALAGILVSAVGYPWTYVLDVVLFTGAFVGILGLPRLRPEGDTVAPGFASLIESFRFLRRAPNVRATFIVDLIAMCFGTPRVVFPAVGALVLGGGPITVGVLTAAFAVGALASGVLSGPLGRVRRQGRAVTGAVAVYGACIAAFGTVLLMTMWIVPPAPRAGVLWLGLVCAALALAAAGAADNVSAVFRTTILQAAAPDDVRGRMQGLFFVVVTGGPRVGDLVAGALATLIAVWAPALLGGLVVLALMTTAVRWLAGFQRYDAANPTP